MKSRMCLGCALAALMLVPAIRPGAAQAPSPPGDGCAIRYVANAGILFESHATSFLIDAPIRESLPPYAVPEADERRALESAQAPFDRVAAILITHWHEDHLSAPAVGELLRNSPATVLLSSREVVARVREAAPNVAPARLIALTPEPGRSERTTIGGVPVHVLRIRHNPARRLPEQHVGFLVEGCRTVLHVGDADPRADNFSVLRSLPRVHVAALPFWYLLTDRNRQFVRASIDPGRVVAIHVPPSDSTDVSEQLRDAPDVSLLARPGTRVELIAARPR